MLHVDERKLPEGAADKEGKAIVIKPWDWNHPALIRISKLRVVYPVDYFPVIYNQETSLLRDKYLIFGVLNSAENWVYLAN